MKKILFLTGTRADFGKLKSLIAKVEEAELLDAHIFVTGMHMQRKYGMTVNEVEKCGFSSVYQFINQSNHDTMDIVLAKTISGLSDYIKEVKPDLIIVHGDRVEALAGAVVGSLNNVLVGHVEGGEVSGTIDELIRHSVSKMAHIHFVCNEAAKNRLIQLGELESSIFIIGSPDIDLMTSSELPSIEAVKKKYDLPFDDYNIFMYHPVTTELDALPNNISQTISALVQSGKNYVVIYPNNDHGTDIILNNIEKIKNNESFRVFPSIRFECFLTLIKYSSSIIGNSSAGVREAPFYGVPTINLGTRQYNRSKAESILNCDENVRDILKSLSKLSSTSFKATKEFGDGKSNELFISILKSQKMWGISKQKSFVDIN